MTAARRRKRSTRWDCDVRLRRGIPVTPPAFHGWKKPEPEPEPVRDTRCYACHHCGAFVPEDRVPGHACWNRDAREQREVADLAPGQMTDEEFSRHWEDLRREDGEEKEEEEEEEGEESRPPRHVVVTEEAEGAGGAAICVLCRDRLTMEFDPGEEEWVYRASVLVHGRVVHESCLETVFGRGRSSGSITHEEFSRCWDPSTEEDADISSAESSRSSE